MYTNETIPSDENEKIWIAKIIVANRISFFDDVALRKFFSNDKCKTVCDTQTKRNFIEYLIFKFR